MTTSLKKTSKVVPLRRRRPRRVRSCAGGVFAACVCCGKPAYALEDMKPELATKAAKLAGLIDSKAMIATAHCTECHANIVAYGCPTVT